MAKLVRCRIVFFSFIITVASLLLYLPTLKSGFIWDDLQLTLQAPINLSKNPYAFFFGGGVYFRPFLHLSMMLDYSFWNLNAYGYHLTNILLHIINSLLCFLTGFYLLKKCSLLANNILTESVHRHDALLIPFSSAVLFAVHPVHTESVAWISARTDMLATLFFLLAFLAFLLYIERESFPALILSSIFFLFALFSKENAVAFIGVTVVFCLLAKTERNKLLSSLFFSVLTFSIYLFFRKGSGLLSLVTPPGSKDAFFRQGLTFLDIIKNLLFGAGYYIEKSFLPFQLNLLPPIPVNPVYIIICFIFLFSVIFFYIFKKRLEFFLLVWFFLALAPSMLIVFTQRAAAPLGERYLYLPSIGITLLLSFLVFRIKPRKAASVIMVLLVLAYSAFAHIRLTAWADNLTIWEDTVIKNPDSVNAKINYAQALLENKQLATAKKVLLTLLDADKISWQQKSALYDLLAKVELELKNYDFAKKYIHQSLKEYPRNPMAYNLLGIVYLNLAESSLNGKEYTNELLLKAINSFKKALMLSPNFIQPRFNLGLSYLKYGNLAKAEKSFQTLVEYAPRSNLAKQAQQFLFLIGISNIGNGKESLDKQDASGTTDRL